MAENIFPIFDRLITREDKEARLNQKSKVFWFTGLSGSGKSTLSIALSKILFENGYFVQVLDGDNIRSGINNNLGFSSEDRIENIRRIAEIARLFKNGGVITICAFVSPTKQIRNMARTIIGSEDFIEVFVNTPIETCEERDVKGLYKKAREGKIKDFTGVNAPFEPAMDANIVINTKDKSIEDCVKEIIDSGIIDIVKYP